MPKITIANVMEHELIKNQEFMDAFDDYLSMRKLKKKPTTERAKKLLLKTAIDLSNANCEIAVLIIDRSNKNGWTDFYPLPDELRPTTLFTASTRREEG